MAPCCLHPCQASPSSLSLSLSLSLSRRASAAGGPKRVHLRALRRPSCASQAPRRFGHLPPPAISLAATPSGRHAARPCSPAAAPPRSGPAAARSWHCPATVTLALPDAAPSRKGGTSPLLLPRGRNGAPPPCRVPPRALHLNLYPSLLLPKISWC